MGAATQAAALAAACEAQTDALLRLRAMIEDMERNRVERLAGLREAGAALLEAIDTARRDQCTEA